MTTLVSTFETPTCPVTPRLEALAQVVYGHLESMNGHLLGDERQNAQALGYLVMYDIHGAVILYAEKKNRSGADPLPILDELHADLTTAPVTLAGWQKAHTDTNTKLSKFVTGLDREEIHKAAEFRTNAQLPRYDHYAV